MKYEIQIFGLSSSKDLWSDKVVPTIKDQLLRQGKKKADTKRYRVTAIINEGSDRPAKDVENYIKPIIDSITYSGLVWIDDEQIDEIVIKRIRRQEEVTSEVELAIENIP